MKIDSFHKLYIHSLQDIFSAEEQIAKALPKMIKAASNESLKNAFQTHLEETETHIERLEQVFESLEMSPGGMKCEVMEELVEEGEDLIDNISESGDLLDAALIAAAQKIEHYEVASYGTIVTFAEMLGDNEAASLLRETLEEEKSTDGELTDLAMNMVNPQAVEQEEGTRPSAM